MDMNERLEKARIARQTGPKKGPVKHTIRTRDGGLIEVELTRSRAIKAMCTECGGYGEMHPKDCSSPHCPLFPYRGKIQLAYQGSDVTTPEDSEPDGEPEAD